MFMHSYNILARRTLLERLRLELRAEFCTNSHQHVMAVGVMLEPRLLQQIPEHFRIGNVSRKSYSLR